MDTFLPILLFPSKTALISIKEPDPTDKSPLTSMRDKSAKRAPLAISCLAKSSWYCRSKS